MVNLAMKDHGKIFKEIEAITIIYKCYWFNVKNIEL